MEQVIGTSQSPNNMWPIGFSTLETLANEAGYKLELNDDYELTISVNKFAESDILPTIKATKCNELSGSHYEGYYYNVEVTYPKFNSMSATYADDMEYQVKKFAAAAKFVTELVRWHS